MPLTINLKKTPLLLEDFQTVGDIVHNFAWGEDKFCCLAHATEGFMKRYKILYAQGCIYNDYGEAYVLGYDKKNKMWFDITAQEYSEAGAPLKGLWNPLYFTSLKDMKKDLYEREYFPYGKLSRSRDLEDWLWG